MSDDGIQGKVALVTGAAQGIGAAVARSLAELGAIIAAVDRNAEGVSRLVDELVRDGYRATAFPVDVSHRAAVDEMVEQIEHHLGPVGILVNVAGVLRIGLVDTLRDSDWTETFAVNTNGVFYISRAVVKHMIPRKSGSIVTVGSNAGAVPRMYMAAYAASKAASAMFTKCLGLEVACHHIRCNVVSPGSTETEMQWSLWSDESGAQAAIDGSPNAYKVGIPLRRLADPAEIADAVVFLVSDKSRHITMHDLRIDGGATLGV
ncbi:2,3-dihydro-2,3-dihydroxybenzoate dehydrogenase [Paenibacillus polymyxa]|uniref:2,3-dihydro-2,3-dihydroxybenzoate dehydrogenase n=1 Tax=Paenibacillus polymyxa TaxID=1406 RepID=UPI00278E3D9B|nr:2,3-dihydro-2,3-dihydroxybenzoate dehydrogenase [Paenibacillus polymyxa]MDQ0047470.1 2,3-dihydro-2,3-dihydroxybenzoate dehydrogenase [Paenibacillus polymyxa]